MSVRRHGGFNLLTHKRSTEAPAHRTIQDKNSGCTTDGSSTVNNRYQYITYSLPAASASSSDASAPLSPTVPSPAVDLSFRIRKENDVTMADIQVAQDSKVDNTGNVCVWPSEEILAYYCLQHQQLFDGKRVLELGAGMSGLAGCVIAASSSAKQVTVTDGNPQTCMNLGYNVALNKTSGIFGSTAIGASELKWDRNAVFGHGSDVRSQATKNDNTNNNEKKKNGNENGSHTSSNVYDNGHQNDTKNGEAKEKDGDKNKCIDKNKDTPTKNYSEFTGGQYDFIIAADCLFFKDYHRDLIHVLKSLLAPGGKIVIIGPRRGTTLELFLGKLADSNESPSPASESPHSSSSSVSSPSSVPSSSYWKATVREDFLDIVTRKHVSFLSSSSSASSEASTDSYDPDIHRPLLLELERQ